MKTITILFISLALLTSACVSSQAGGGKLTIPSAWKLVSFGTTEAERPIVEGSSITLEIGEDGQIGGSGGCNSYGGMSI